MSLGQSGYYSLGIAWPAFWLWPIETNFALPTCKIINEDASIAALWGKPLSVMPASYMDTSSRPSCPILDPDPWEGKEKSSRRWPKSLDPCHLSERPGWSLCPWLCLAWHWLSGKWISECKTLSFSLSLLFLFFVILTSNINTFLKRCVRFTVTEEMHMFLEDTVI